MASKLGLVVLLISGVCAARCAAVVTTGEPVVAGLSWGFYDTSCPSVEGIVRWHVTEALRRDIGIAAGLVRIFFHDCFPQGCDASVLLTGEKSELGEIPNKTLRPSALKLIQDKFSKDPGSSSEDIREEITDFILCEIIHPKGICGLQPDTDEGYRCSVRPSALKLIEDIRAAVHSACGAKVSCADITTLATRDAVVASGGPYFDVPLGRRDGLAPASSDKVGLLPAPSFDVPTLIQSFKDRNLDKADLVALSGAHTIGLGHCPSFNDRFDGSKPTMDPALVKKLQAKCAKDVPENTVTQELDVRTPNAFDNKYYFDLIAKQGIFKSDQGLIEHADTNRTAVRFALNQGAFFDQFARSMVKMSQMDVLTDNAGEIRNNCAAPNRRSSDLLTAADKDQGFAADA